MHDLFTLVGPEFMLNKEKLEELLVINSFRSLLKAGTVGCLDILLTTMPGSMFYTIELHQRGVLCTQLELSGQITILRRWC